MQLDGACDVHGANAQFRAYWTAMEDARLMAWDGLRIYINPPFRLFMAILLQFLRCKARCQLGTSAMFIMPVWESADFYRLVRRLPHVFTTVREWPAGAQLFTSRCCRTWARAVCTAVVPPGPCARFGRGLFPPRVD